MTKDEALKMALEALEGADMIDCDMREAITAIKEALAQLEPEYLAFMDTPHRTWVEIDGDDWIKALEMADFDKAAAFEFFEAKLKELNT